MTTLTRQQQREAEAREKAATQGPWRYTCKGDGFIIGGEEHLLQTWSKMEEDFPNAEANGEFIARVRTDAPLAYATIARMEPLVEALAKRECLNLLQPHLAEHIGEELEARNWTLLDLAARFGGQTEEERKIDFLALQMFMAVCDKGVLLGELGVKMAGAFGVSAEMFQNIHDGWCNQPDCGKCETCQARQVVKERLGQKDT